MAYVLKIFPKLSETFIASELAELQRRGIELRILSLLPPREELAHEFVIQAGLRELACYDPHTFAEVLEAFEPDILHAHFATESAAAAMQLSASSGIPFTFTCHGYDIYRKPPADFSNRAAAAGRVITVSNANAEHLVQTFDVPRDHIEVIPCGVDTARFSRNGSHRHGGPPSLVCVARLVHVKNIELLLNACALLRDAGLNFRCRLVGDGPLRSELLATRERLGLSQLVEMPGALVQEQVVQCWQHADLGVLTSSSEGMPVCLMEAAACGVPVVATAVGGVPELVKNESTGLLVAPGDAAALAGALERLLLDPDRRRRMGAAARQLAVARFSVVRQVDHLLNVWSGVLSLRTSR